MINEKHSVLKQDYVIIKKEDKIGSQKFVPKETKLTLLKISCKN